jgi:hypothetical protein
VINGVCIPKEGKDTLVYILRKKHYIYLGENFEYLNNMWQGISKDEDETVFRNYKIVVADDKYGIIDNKDSKQIVETIFDYIEWKEDDELVEFRLGDKYAICHVSDLTDF